MKAQLGVIGVAWALLLVPAAAAAQGAAHDWSGFSLGVYGGPVWERIDYVEPDDPEFSIHPDTNGFVGGALVGYNHQADRFVIGLEADGGASSLKFHSNDPTGNDYVQIDLGWNGHVRGRAGYARSRLLAYFAGGLAIGRVMLDDTDPEFGVDRATHVGWTAGGGLECAATSRLGLRAEYLYEDYGTKHYSISSPPTSPFFPAYAADISLTAHTLRAVVFYRF